MGRIEQNSTHIPISENLLKHGYKKDGPLAQLVQKYIDLDDKQLLEKTEAAYGERVVSALTRGEHTDATLNPSTRVRLGVSLSFAEQMAASGTYNGEIKKFFIAPQARYNDQSMCELIRMAERTDLAVVHEEITEAIKEHKDGIIYTSRKLDQRIKAETDRCSDK